MPSASKRYQSRLFNFFHKQSQRFGEGFGRSLRQLQVATSWSLEALAQSIYLLLQKAVDSAANQLPVANEESKLQLQPSAELVSDSAIAIVLESIETQYIPSSPNKSTNITVSASCSLSDQPTLQNVQKIRGIASQLSSQSLVLVTSENEVLDILTASQQQALENKIIAEIANYWRCWRLSQEEPEKLLSQVESILKRLAPSNRNTTKILPEVNVVVKINPNTLTSLDTAVAKLEINALAPISRAQIIVQQRGSELIKAVKTKLDIFLYGNQQANINSEKIVTDNNLETQKSKIAALIWAALNYFYKEPQGKKIKQAPTRQLSENKSNLQLPNQQSTDDWLTFNDLFNSELPQLKPRNQVSDKIATIQKQLKPSKPKNGRFQLPNWRTLRLKEKAGLQKPQKSTRQIGQDSRITNNKLSSAAKTSQISQKIVINPASESDQNQTEITQSRESTQIEAKPEWIETKAELIGYQKHPLEQLLALIDNAMLKIEQILINFANVLQQFLRK